MYSAVSVGLILNVEIFLMHSFQQVNDYLGNFFNSIWRLSNAKSKSFCWFTTWYFSSVHLTNAFQNLFLNWLWMFQLPFLNHSLLVSHLMDFWYKFLSSFWDFAFSLSAFLNFDTANKHKVTILLVIAASSDFFCLSVMALYTIY